MKSLLPIFCTLLIFSGCVDYDGSFHATEKLKFKHSTVFGNTKTKSLKAGRYNTSFEVTSGKKLKFTFRGDETVEVKIDVPESIELPSSDGSFFFMAEETGQNYDIKGDINTDYSSSGLISGVESCSYQRVERQCRRVCTEQPILVPAPRVDRPTRPTRPVTPRVSCRNICQPVSVTHYGHQNVRYRINYTKKTLQLSMNEASADKQVASYRGLDESSSRSYEYRGRCL